MQDDPADLAFMTPTELALRQEREVYDYAQSNPFEIPFPASDLEALLKETCPNGACPKGGDGK